MQNRIHCTCKADFIRPRDLGCREELFQVPFRIRANSEATKIKTRSGLHSQRYRAHDEIIRVNQTLERRRENPTHDKKGIHSKFEIALDPE